MQDEMVKLQDEVNLGNKARGAYTGYVKDFIERTSAELYQEFVIASDDELSLSVKRKHDALMSLENSILRDIETGSLAAKQLEIIGKE
jgi:hypothetical protein